MKNENATEHDGKRGLIAVLIVANLLMLVIGIVTIPPNLRAKAEKKISCADGGANRTYHTAVGGRRKSACDHRKR